MAKVIHNEILIPEIESLLKAGKTVLFTPSGVSMRPWIEGGQDTVTLQRSEHPKVGDIALCEVNRQPIRYVLHRIIRMEADRITLMGDGNLQGCEYCNPSQVIGIVTRITSPKGHRKPLTKGYLWRKLLPVRKYLLKIYRHTPRLL